MPGRAAGNLTSLPRLALDWRRIRRRGALNFVVRYGVFGWGLATALIYTVIVLAAGAPNPGAQFFFAVLLFPMLGWPVGTALWLVLERRHRGRGAP